MFKWLKDILSKDRISGGTEEDERLKDVSKAYVQFSKRIVLLCVTNLIAIEIFSMWMIYSTLDTTQISYLITSIAIECLGAIIWYMKNSEAEKKARIASEIEKMRIDEENRRREEENKRRKEEYDLMLSGVNYIPQEDVNSNTDNSNNTVNNTVNNTNDIDSINKQDIVEELDTDNAEKIINSANNLDRVENTGNRESHYSKNNIYSKLSNLPSVPTVYNNYVDEIEQPQHHTGGGI